jgi:hypothetical protein
MGLGEEQIKLFRGFTEWCKQYGVRSLPARPTTIAAYLQTGVADCLAAAEAIRLAHQAQLLPCPIGTDCVRAVLSELLQDKPPRSWKSSEQLLWAELPPEIRAAVARREHERELVIRRCQNQAAAAKAELKRLSDSAETKPVTPTNEETQ